MWCLKTVFGASRTAKKIDPLAGGSGLEKVIGGVLWSLMIQAGVVIVKGATRTGGFGDGVSRTAERYPGRCLDEEKSLGLSYDVRRGGSGREYCG